MNKEEHSVYAIKFYAMQKQIDDLQKKAELGEHYKHLYSKVKKQKDDVVEYIKSAIENDDIEELKESRHLLLWNEDLDKLLRMLGEIDD